LDKGVLHWGFLPFWLWYLVVAGAVLLMRCLRSAARWDADSQGGPVGNEDGPDRLALP